MDIQPLPLTSNSSLFRFQEKASFFISLKGGAQSHGQGNQIDLLSDGSGCYSLPSQPCNEVTPRIYVGNA